MKQNKNHKKKAKRNELFSCTCGERFNKMVVSEYANSENIFVSIRRIKNPWLFKRIGSAFMYVFGKRSLRNGYDEIVMNKYEAERLRDAIDNKLNEIEKKQYARKSKKRRNNTEARLRKAGR